MLLFLSLCAGAFLVYQLFVQRGGHSIGLWEKFTLQRHLATGAQHSFHQLDQQQLLAGLDDSARAASLQSASSTDNTQFVLSAYSLPVHRSLWRIVEYVLSDFIGWWWVKISDTPDFENDCQTNRE